MKPGSRLPHHLLPRLGAGGAPEALFGDGSGRPTLMTVFKKDCPTCRLLLPFLERLHMQTKGAGGRVIGVAQDPEEVTTGLVRELGITFPVFLDEPDYQLSNGLDLLSVPAMYLVEDNGTVRRASLGFNRNELTQMADDLAASAGGLSPVLWSAEESVPELRPG